jgi:hypothetical protein
MTMNLISPPSEIQVIFEVFCVAPYPSYPGEMRSQLYSTRVEAERMREFNESCGCRSYVKVRTVNELQ